MKRIKLGLIFTALAFFIFACTKPTDNTDNSVAQNTDTKANTVGMAPVDELAMGREIFTERCVRCHKTDGTGGKQVVDDKEINAEDFTTSHVKKMSDDDFIEHITDGIIDEGMPSFKDILSNDEMLEVVKFIRGEFHK